MALKRVWIGSPNYSSRSGSGVRLVVVHTAEGARSFRDLGHFFAASSARVSSHVGIDNELGTIGEYVSRSNKAWTQSAYNSQAISVELCGAPFGTSSPCGASWSTDEWNKHDKMLTNLADWIREECNHYGIPMVKLSSGQAQGSSKGVCGHFDLGTGGGGHHDPGPNFPWQRVMNMVRGGSPAPGQPTTPGTPLPITKEDMIHSVVKKNGAIEVFVEKASTGNVYHTWQSEENGKWYSKDGKQIDWQAMGNPGK